MNEEENLNGKIKSLIEKAKSLGISDSDIKDCNNQESCLDHLILQEEFKNKFTQKSQNQKLKYNF